jgi:hypothetical protein
MDGVRPRPALSACFMASSSPLFTGLRVWRRPAGRLAAAGMVVVVTAILAGCAVVPVWRQGPVSKPNMVFNDRGAFVFGPRGGAHGGGVDCAILHQRGF